MTRRCSICTHPKVAEINAALIAGESQRAVAKLFGTSKSSLQRHSARHLAAVVAMAQEAARADAVEIVREHEASDVRHALDVVTQLKAINEASLKILEEARDGKSKDSELALKAVDRLHRQIVLQAKLVGQLDERPQINVLLDPQWIVIRTALMDALGPFPDASEAVARALVEVDGARP